MTCPDCAIAEQNPKTGHYNAYCDICSARALANSQPARWAYVNRDPGPLQAAMRKMFPTAERYRLARIETHRWWKILNPE